MKFFNKKYITIGFFVSIAAAHAGTYNFYFNNIEQGDHSVANPNVTIETDDKGRVIKASASPSPSPSISQSHEAEPSPGPSPTPSAEPSRTALDQYLHDHPVFNHFRVGLGPVYMGERQSPRYVSGYQSDSLEPNPAFQEGSTPRSLVGNQLSFGYQFNEDFGLQAVYTSYNWNDVGHHFIIFESIITPMHAGIFDLGMNLGIHTYSTEAFNQERDFYGNKVPNTDPKAGLSFGPRIIANLNDTFALGLGYRTDTNFSIPNHFTSTDLTLQLKF